MPRRCLVPILGVLLFARCSTPPDKERHQAEGAIAAAREAGAETYAPSELGIAEAALDKYQAAVAQRDYRLALSLAVEARDTAYQAAKRSADGKAAARSEAEHLAADVSRAIERIRTAGARPAPRIRAVLLEAEKALQEARTQSARGDYRDASRTLAPVLQRLQAEPGASPTPASKRPR